jgi:drug/metabolite transporter (DMT)-like permease
MRPPMRDQDGREAAIGLTILSALLLGSQYVVIKMGVEGQNPLYLGACIMTVGVLVVVAYMAWRRSLSWKFFHHWEFWAGAAANLAVVAFLLVGLTLTTASVSGLIVGSNALFVALFSFVIFREGLSPKRVLGLIIGFVGLVTITTHWDLATLESGQLLGDLLVLVASISVAVVVILSRGALKKMSYDQWSFGLHFLLPPALLVLGLVLFGDEGLSSDVWPTVLFVGALCTTLPTLMWTFAFPKLGAVTSATILMLESVFAVLLGVIILGEPLDAYVVVGALMTFSAIFLVANGK